MKLAKPLKNAMEIIFKGIAAIAWLVFFFANPIGDNSGIAFIISIFVLIGSLSVLGFLEYLTDESDNGIDTSYDPKQSG